MVVHDSLPEVMECSELHSVALAMLIGPGVPWTRPHMWTESQRLPPMFLLHKPWPAVGPLSVSHFLVNSTARLEAVA